MDNYDLKLSATIQAQKATTESFEASNLVLDTFKKSWDQTLVTIQAFGTSIGQILAGPLGTLINTLKVVITWLGKFSIVKYAVAGLIAFSSITVVIAIALKSLSFIVGATSKLFVSLTTSVKTTETALTGYTAKIVAAAGATSFLWKTVNTVSGILTKWNAIIAGVSIALGLLAALWTSFSSGQSAGSNATKDFTASSETSIKKSKERIKALKAENELLKDMPAKIKKLADVVASNQQENILDVKAIEKLDNKIALLPKSYDDVTYAVNDFYQALKLNKVEIDDITKSTEAYIRVNKGLISDLEDLTAEQQARFIRKEEIKIFDAQAIIDDLKRFAGEVGKTTLGKGIELDFEVKTPGGDKDVKNLFDALEDQLAKGGGNLTGFEIVTPFVNKVKKPYLAELDDLYEKVKLYDKEKGTDLASQFEGQKEKLAKIFEDIRTAWTRAIRAVGSEDFKLSEVQAFTKEQQKEALSIFEGAIIGIKSRLKSEFGASGIFGNVLEPQVATIQQARRAILSVSDAAKEVDSSFQIGVKIPGEVARIRTSVRDMIFDLKNSGKEFETLVTTLDFGSLLDLDKFTAGKSKDFIADVGAKVLEAQKELSNFNQEFKDLGSILQDISKTDIQFKFDEGKFEKEDVKILQDIVAGYTSVNAQNIGLAEKGPALAIGDRLRKLTPAIKLLGQLIESLANLPDLFDQVINWKAWNKF